MSLRPYDDPWAYCARLFLGRLVLFFALSLLLGLSLWAGVLHWVFGADGVVIVQTTWRLLNQPDVVWSVIFWQAGASGMLLTALVFMWLMGRSRRTREEREAGRGRAATVGASH
jgi:hypothetical protein